MIIDGHSHVTLPIEEHIQLMDQVGIDKTILFSTTFHPELANNAQEVKEKMKYLNDLLAGKKGSMLEARKASIMELVNAIKQYPNRYIGFGAVPVGLSLNETKEYIEENIVRNNLAGVGEFSLGAGQAHLLEVIFEAAREYHKLPIWIHAFNPFTLKDIQETVSIANQFPEIPVILGHLGGTNWIETMDMVAETPNLYLDTSAFYSTFVLSTIINEIPEKCIFGVDMPYGDLELSKQAILKYAKTSDISKAVLGDNIAKILNI
ncbi:amidohydrolase family protein [Anaeromicropila herbilytica]|uniref:Amidohydrolase n=1 Tax=Anaeromicropila herbilytica TaxID=2785025 RepID=A0A7R7ELQ5_9FIRM|nr:amidohydrolase family protein [Anaeromicropila herbilytica]BCN30890.1 amidohydrolase [Anaeromicropila herbilytica]